MNREEITMRPFIFIVESSTSPGKPLLFKATEELMDIGRNGKVNEFTGKPYTKEMVESKIKLNPNYSKAMNAFINAKFKWGQVDAAVKAYESRERLLQTISSNLRKENL